jgi:hypothetical protein
MVRDWFMTLCGGALMVATWSGFGAYIAPEPAELKLARIMAGLDRSIRRTLPPDTKIVKCVMVWVGGPGGEPELWCPPVPLEEPELPAVPTS